MDGFLPILQVAARELMSDLPLRIKNARLMSDFLPIFGYTSDGTRLLNFAAFDRDWDKNDPAAAGPKELERCPGRPKPKKQLPFWNVNELRWVMALELLLSGGVISSFMKGVSHGST